MTPARWEQVNELFHLAVSRSAGERAGLLEHACKGDAELRRQVEKLLAADANPSDPRFLEPPSMDANRMSPNLPGFAEKENSQEDSVTPTLRGCPTETLDPKRISALSPDRIGAYHIKRVIASGGMGTVYEATQDNPRRVVAVKMMKQGIASRSALRRFEYEGQILGRLRHPGIAQIYEAGTHNDGHGAVPYFAMEYIPNARLITTYADEKKLGTRQRMELFAKVCDAIHHGHQKGIIHRDLKPSNILVDSAGQVKIIDFGVARCTDSDMAVTTMQTDVGQLIGTLQYMSPEQCEGDPHDIDTRSDVYALGVVFYQLLCGKLPYDVTRMAMHQATRAIREQTPTKLSTVNHSLRGDVETIALKALEKERERRYQSAADFAHDIQRYLTGEAILARRASIVYQLRLFARRNKAVFASLAAVFIVLVAGIIVSTSLYVRAEHARLEQTRERQRAELERDKAEKFAEFMEQTLEGVGPSVALGRDNTMLKELMDAAAKRIANGELAPLPEAEVRLRVTIGNVYREIAAFEAADGMLNPAVELAQRTHGAQSAEYATALDAHGLWLLSMNRFPEALPELEEALAIRQRVFPGDHPDVAGSLHNVAESLRLQRRLPEALFTYEQALAMRQRLFPGDHADVAQGLQYVAECLGAQERHAEALSMHQQALAMRQRLFPGDHPDVSESLNGVAGCMSWLGRSAEALPNAEEVLAMRRRLYPGDHPRVTNALNVVAVCLHHLERWDEAAVRYEEALDIRRRLYPGDNLGVSANLGMLGTALLNAGRAAEALPRFEESLAMNQRLFPEGHRSLASNFRAIGVCMQSLGRAAEALPNFEKALSVHRRLFSGDHPDTANALSDIAFCLISMGQFGEALGKFEEARDIYRRTLPPGDDWPILVADAGVGRAMSGMGRYVEAELLMVPACNALVDRSDLNAQLKRKYLKYIDIVELYESWDTTEPGKGYGEKAAEWRTKLEGIAIDKNAPTPKEGGH